MTVKEFISLLETLHQGYDVLLDTTNAYEASHYVDILQVDENIVKERVIIRGYKLK